ncbi:MAG: hypothetical protein HY063_12745 [Bacteroidetes bacterium]|nr:hypothetical protein [Bacteroidota bacterium]
MKRFFFILGIFLCFASCKKDKNSPALLFIYPQALVISLKPLQVTSFSINGSSDAAALSRFIIRSKIPLQNYVTLLDTSLSSKKFAMTFDYQAPSYSQTTNIQLQFILSDADGNETQMGRTISDVVASGDVPKETSGNEMYSSITGKPNAYDLSKCLPLYSSTAAIADQHIKDSTVNDSNGTYLMSRKWVSPAGLKFVRFNDFDYPNATYASLKQSYAAGVKKSFMTNITQGDIILTRLSNSNPDSGYMAIKLVYVIDADTTGFDRYIFNVKK